MTTVAIAGDTMLGRLCAERTGSGDVAALVADEVREALARADLFIANLECCISDRGQRWADPHKRFFFRAPPPAARVLADLGVDVVTLANNHALDYGPQALLDTIRHCTAAGIEVVGAGPDVETARATAIVEASGTSICVVPAADHPADFAAGSDRPGIAFADLQRAVPAWLTAAIETGAHRADVVLVTPHWGPNMTTTPPAHVIAAADAMVAAGAAIVAGHSAHVFHGLTWRDTSCVIYDTGDFIDDYAVDAQLRNDLGVLWTIRLDGGRPVAVEALPLYLDTCRTIPATGTDAEWVSRRLRQACAPYGTTVAQVAGTLVCQAAP